MIGRRVWWGVVLVAGPIVNFIRDATKDEPFYDHGWFAALVFAAVFAPLLSPHGPLEQDLFLGRMPPFWAKGAEPGYYLGTDSLGRDLLAGGGRHRPADAARRAASRSWRAR